jgi:hypothetical protein
MENECRHLTAPFSTCGQGSKGYESLLESWQARIEDRVIRALIMRDGERKAGHSGRAAGLVRPCYSRAGIRDVFAPVKIAGSLPVRT